MKPVSPPRATLFVAGLFLTGLALGSWAGRAAVARATSPYDGLDRFARMLTAIEADYVEAEDVDHLLDAAVAGMVAELDPHSRWMSADAVRELEADADGSAIGFGIDVGVREGGVVVLDVLPGSPAEREGLTAGDRILSIDGVGLQGLELTEIEERFQGARGEPSDLEVLREGWEAPVRMATKRDSIRIPATESALLPGDVMYVRVVDFQRHCAEELAADVARLQEQATTPWKGLLLDLRDNTGGLLDEAVAVADLFLDEGPIVSVRGRSRDEQVHRASSGAFPAEMPVFVLVDGVTASASEIVAGALQETGRARLVGTPTYGKGSVQQLYRNPDGSALKLTVARYHLPSGAPILSRQGLQPDIRVEPAPRSSVRERLRTELQSLELQPTRREELLALVEALDERPARLHRLSWTVPVADRATLDPVVVKALEQL
ncbi:MAG: S41 family peptidase [Alphaproteobacteria bacterium]|nr:S41 family peptidase [Alphaproteobacteria bacterium]